MPPIVGDASKTALAVTSANTISVKPAEQRITEAQITFEQRANHEKEQFEKTRRCEILNEL